MKTLTLLTGSAVAIVVATAPLSAAPNTTIWNSTNGPLLPLQYIESTPILRFPPQSANQEIYASEALYLRLYPSIPVDVSDQYVENANIQPSIASKKSIFGQNSDRVNLSPYYVQELAYVDTYSNIRKYDDFISFPNIQMSLAMSQFGNGLGGGYSPFRFGFGPIGFGTR